MIVHLVVPAGIDDPLRPSGGNVYDRRLAAGLERLGWTVREHRVADREGPARVLASLPEGSTALVDGLVGATAAGTVAASRRLRLVLLLHMAEATRAVLGSVAAVVTTSAWTRQWVLEQQVAAERVHVAEPGVDPAPPVTGSPGGERLLCVGPATPAKGYDVLVDALDLSGDLDWSCTWVGAGAPGRVGRLTLTGPLSAAELDEVRSGTDLVVAPSLREAYGMAVAEGLARAIPVVASEVGGLPAVVGDAGLLVPPGDAGALAGALRRWLTDAGLRARLRGAAARRRTELPTWSSTAESVAEVLTAVNRAAPALVSPVSPHRGREG